MIKGEEYLVECSKVSKKFCIDLKKSLSYGVIDIVSKIFKGRVSDKLRPKEFWAINNISFRLKRGEALGLLGHNGAGKTTLLKLINNLMLPDKGSMTVRGKVGALIALGAGFNPILTGRENIYINGSILGFTKKEIDAKIDEIIDFAEIHDFIDAPVQNYSSGMQVRLGFAVASSLNPDILIIDEVLAVGDAQFRMKCLSRISRMSDSVAIIFVSHSIPYIARLCSKVMVMREGCCELITDEVGKAVEHYYSGIQFGGQKIIGTGEAILDKIRLWEGSEDKGNYASTKITCGSDLNFEFSIRFTRSLNKASIRIVIWNQEMRPVCDAFSEANNFFIKTDPSIEQRVHLKLKNVRLNVGKYSIVVVVLDSKNGAILARVDNAIDFQVKYHYNSWAETLLACDWETIG